MRIFILLFAICSVLPVLGHAQAPVLVSTLPARHTVTGNRTGPIQLFFSQAVANPTAIRVNTDKLRGKRAGTFSGANTQQVSFQPSQPFSAGERVSVTVPASVSSPARVVEFRAAASLATATFGLPVTIGPPPTTQPSIVVAGDLDNDGDLDLVAGESTGARLCINSGSGQFTASAALVTIASPAEDLRLADFNGDGNLDLLSSSKYNTNVTVNLGTGQGTFLPGMTVLAASFVVQLVTGDFNADGISDVVLGEAVGAGLNLRFLPGSVSGLQQTTLTSSATLAGRDLGAADMDEDGDLDLLLVTDVTLGVYLNNGSGQFTAGSSVSVNPLSAKLTIGDFTGDGHVDVVCSSAQSANVSLVPGTGTGGLGPAQSVGALSRTWNVSSGDLDGDGDLDLLVTNDRGITQVLLNTGSGQFSSATSVLIGFEPFAMADAADLNGDGTLDIYTGHDVSNPSMPHGLDIFFNQPVAITATVASNSPLVLDVFPNPAHEQLTLRLPAGRGLAKVNLQNILGQVVRTFPPQAPDSDGSVGISLTGLVPGFYLLHASTATSHGVRRIEVL